MNLGEHDTAAHRSAFTASRPDRDRMLEAIHNLETALAGAASGAAWFTQVVAELDVLEAATSDERRELTTRCAAGRGRGCAPSPIRAARSQNLREQYDDIVRQVRALPSELDHAAATPASAADLRHRAGWIIQAPHHCRAQQTDRVYEALELDLGER